MAVAPPELNCYWCIHTDSQRRILTDSPMKVQTNFIGIFFVIVFCGVLVANYLKPLSTHWNNVWVSTAAGRMPSVKALQINDPTTMAFQRNRKALLITNGSLLQQYFRDGTAEFKHCPNLKPHMKCNFSSASYQVWNQSDAVIFRALYVKKPNELWRHRPAGQVWVFEEHESPMMTWRRPEDAKKIGIWDKFNATILFTKDADVYHYQYDFPCKLKPAPNRRIQRNYLLTKKKSVLWLVTNCHLTMGRELYVDELKKHIDVDVIGGCGRLVNCSRDRFYDISCVSKLLSRYKFYLAFENSFCEGYYTEKANKALWADIIPVVMGLVNYSQLLAPGTFIDVRDFKSPKHLAEYLTKVGSDDKLYGQYIEKKNRLRCRKISTRNHMCNLCKYLHDHRGETHTLPNMREFWGREKRCMSPDKFFKGIADEIIPRLKGHHIF